MPREGAPLPRTRQTIAVAHVHWALPPIAGGVETHLADFSRLLAERGHHVTLFAGQGLVQAGPRVETVPCDLLNLDWYRERRMEASDKELAKQLAETMRAEITRRGIRVVHGHNLHHFTPVPAMALRLLEQDIGVRVYHTYHSVWDTDLHIVEHCRNWPEQHAVSRFLSGLCAQGLSVPTIPVYLGVAEDRYRHIDSPSASGEQVILLPARLFPEKGAQAAVRMLRRLRDEGLSVRLILTGPEQTVDWDQESEPFGQRLKETIADLGLTGHVDFRSVGFGQMPQLYAQANVVIYPSTYPEPLGLAPLEAAAAGRPAVVTRIGGLPETVRHRRTGYVVPPGDLDALTNRVRTLLTHPRRARRMGRAGRAMVRRKFALDAYVDRMVELYRAADV
ncbi:glycosyltransferase family 4 protein [Actinocrinis puniceicyclus]|uniref:Glycosyltransferase family 4 protein n=1 Tax=Actinocrinis puniceicyclus TaxID=977794 RepID=A0A8J7WG36_9ACTN|nr:glycosyltransferase family 4 protein [Actinocrinis puniceicyclus]MBS2961541.1 glycosyltransferase family 4 protein [Actinocrinis puniceicyclus]